LKLPNEKEDLKLSREKKKQKWDAWHLYNIRGINEKLHNPINPKL
jgi:hypothetical protein